MEYLFLDAVFEPIRHTDRTREGVPVAWGICRDGRRVLLHLALGNTGSYENWLALLRDLVKRGLRMATTIASDGAPALITTNLLERAFEEERRRTKVIPRFWTEHSALRLIFGTLDRASRRRQRLTISEIEIKHMGQLR